MSDEDIREATGDETLGDDGSGDVEGLKDTVKRLASQAKSAVVDEGKKAAASLGMRGATAAGKAAANTDAGKAVIQAQKDKAKDMALLVGAGLLLGFVVFKRRGHE